MNGIKCYLSRGEVRKIIAEEVARRLQPDRLLGPCHNDAQFFDDGRIEVTFWTQDSAVVEEEDAKPSEQVPAPMLAEPKTVKSSLHSLLKRESKG